LSGVADIAQCKSSTAEALRSSRTMVRRPTGELELRASSIVVDATSSITANGAGFRGATSCTGNRSRRGTRRWPRRGGWDGRRSGVWRVGRKRIHGGVGGVAYGDLSSPTIEKGSGGGASNYFDSCGVGGNGGGQIVLRAIDINIAGEILANGAMGPTRGQHARERLRGGILIYAVTQLSPGRLWPIGAAGKQQHFFE